MHAHIFQVEDRSPFIFFFSSCCNTCSLHKQFSCLQINISKMYNCTFSKGLKRKKERKEKECDFFLSRDIKSNWTTYICSMCSLEIIPFVSVWVVEAFCQKMFFSLSFLSWKNAIEMAINKCICVIVHVFLCSSLTNCSVLLWVNVSNAANEQYYYYSADVHCSLTPPSPPPLPPSREKKKSLLRLLFNTSHYFVFIIH